ncbi:hypothetical protein D3C74_48980 [compost metagenome]
MSVELEIDSLNLLDVTIKTKNGQSVEYNVGEELKADIADLNEAFLTQPGKFAWWSTLAENAKHQRDSLEATLDKQEAEADYKVRLSLELEGVKVTEAAVKQGIKKDEEYLDALKRYNAAKKTAGILSQVVKAFEQRKEMLISLGANLRKENDNSDIVSLKEKARGTINR